MDFVFLSLGLPFNGETINKKALGGSETAAYYLGKELAARGHRVVMFTTTSEEGMFDGVQYCNCGAVNDRTPLGEKFCHYAEHTPHDVLILQRHLLGFHRDYASKLNILQMHDIGQYRYAGALAGGLQRTNIITTVSEFHKQQIAEVFHLNPDTIKVVHNGVDPALYANTVPITRAPDDKGFDMLYQSRPERGLEHLVRPGGIMERLLDTAARLSICSYDNTTKSMAPYYEQLKKWAERLPNVMWLESLSKPNLAQLQTSCDLLCYPTEFEEVSCITAMEAMFAGLPMLSSAHGALPETCKDTGTLLLPLKNGAVDEDAFVTKIRYLINDRDNPDRERSSLLGALAEKQRNSAHRYTWKKAADTLEQIVVDFFDRQSRNTSAMLRHYIEHSDIVAAEDLLNERLDENLDAIGKVAYDEIMDMYGFSRHGDEVYAAHYDQVENESLRAFGGKETIVKSTTVLESARRETRYTGVRGVLNDAQSKGAKRVLDFASNFGAITVNLAMEFPGLEFHAVDLVQECVDVGNALAESRNISNLKFTRGTVDDLGALAKFDVIIAAEIIEHVRDPNALLEKLRESLQPDGLLIVTTPYGRWESNDAAKFGRIRTHLHHFERTDLLEIFAGHAPQIMCAPSHRDDVNNALGSWVTAVRPKKGHPFGRVDYKRKHMTQAPRQTVSLCIIAKDAEATIRKAVTSVVKYVDEVVIGIDPATTDRTREVIAHMQAEYPFKAWDVFTGVRAIEEGFDAARNLTVERASGQWILWMDADEEVPISSNIPRLLREGSPDAWAMKQVHYSTMPPQVLTTDVPARLFRKNRGIMFYGVVHEHPEQIVGEAVKYTNVCDDVMFAHYGYIDERTRRVRYTRNLPLLMRDLQKHPNRLLNKFLYLRDLAQGLGFEFEQGIRSPDAAQRAEKGCEIFEELVESAPAVRMIVDSMQFYSICNEILGRGFDVTLDVSHAMPGVPELSSKQAIRARFHSREVYLAVLSRLVKETTKHYDSRYA